MIKNHLPPVVGNIVVSPPFFLQATYKVTLGRVVDNIKSWWGMKSDYRKREFRQNLVFGAGVTLFAALMGFLLFSMINDLPTCTPELNKANKSCIDRS